MSIGLAFFHGWGLAPNFWRPLQTALAGHPQTEIQTLWNAGYFSPPEAPDFSVATQWVAIGHSLGWATAWEHAPDAGWLGTVSLCGFTRFCAPAPGLAGQATRVVERMLRAFERNPHQVLHDFLSRCDLAACLPPPITTMDTQALHQGLQRLIDIHVNPPTTACLALASRDDPIVSAALTESCFASQPETQLKWQDHGGHALGYRHAPWCAEQITAFVQGLRHG